MLFNTTLLSLTAAGVLASPLFLPPSTSSLRQFSFSHLFLNHHVSTFYHQLRDKTNINFQNSAFMHFLDSAVVLQDINFVNSTFTNQKSITSLNDVNFIDCKFQFCTSKSQGGAILASSSNIAHFSLKLTSFYNCSAMSNGAILLNQVQELTFDMICFNRCTAVITNQVGLINCAIKNSINSISIYKCPFISQSALSSNDKKSSKNYIIKNFKNFKSKKLIKDNIYGKKNSIVFKGTNFFINSMNSSFNENNDRGVIMNLQNPGTLVSTSNFVNNTGIDGFEIYNGQLYISVSTIATNTFYVAPFQSSSSNNNKNNYNENNNYNNNKNDYNSNGKLFDSIINNNNLFNNNNRYQKKNEVKLEGDNFPNPIYIRLTRINYIGNKVNPSHDITNRVEGNIQVVLVDSFSDSNKFSYPFGIGATITSLGNEFLLPFTYTYIFYQAKACFDLDEPEKAPENDDDIRTKELIVYVLIASCGIVVIIGCSILAITHFQKKRSLRNWIEENEDRANDNDDGDDDNNNNINSGDGNEKKEQKKPLFEWKKSKKSQNFGNEKKNKDSYSSMRIPILVTNQDDVGNSINSSMLKGNNVF